ncbi:hypothetical protein E2C01_043480 [Portunus trituberculatus]|uniref:Uncharacterized protein n=1 Tax=Portunus trituberculatus TaxID=210409 RepID=A0A5B7FPL0_PORTR|nr:hypothetical protein [Portunus trituberculatus]
MLNAACYVQLSTQITSIIHTPPIRLIHKDREWLGRTGMDWEEMIRAVLNWEWLRYTRTEWNRLGRVGTGWGDNESPPRGQCQGYYD